MNQPRFDGCENGLMGVDVAKQFLAVRAGMPISGGVRNQVRNHRTQREMPIRMQAILDIAVPIALNLMQLGDVFDNAIPRLFFRLTGPVLVVKRRAR